MRVKRMLGLVSVVICVVRGIGMTGEIYVPETIIEAKWGDGAGEFGLITNAKPRGTPVGQAINRLEYFRAPSALDVDAKGNIYIFDPVNWRVLIYDNSGKYKTVVRLERDPGMGPLDYKGGYVSGYPWDYDFIKADPEGNIYLNTTDDTRVAGLLRQYTRSGKLAKVYMSKETNERLKKFWTSDEYQQRYGKYDAVLEIIDATYISPLRMLRPNTDPEVSHLLLKLFPSEYYLIDGQTDHTPSSVLSSHYKRAIRSVFYRVLNIFDLTPPTIWEEFREKRQEMQDAGHKEVFYTLVVDEADGALEKIIAIPVLPEVTGHMFHPWKEDIEGNLYIKTAIISRLEEENRFTYLIYKYDFKGDLVGSVNTGLGYSKPYPYICRKGDIYRIVWDINNLEEGLEVVRWRRK